MRFHKPAGTEGLKNKVLLTNSVQQVIKKYHGTTAKPAETPINLLSNPTASCQAFI